MSNRPKSTHPSTAVRPRQPMGAQERQATVDELRRQIRAVELDPPKRRRVRRLIYALDPLADAIVADVTDPVHLETALDLVAQLVLIVQAESEVAR